MSRAVEPVVLKASKMISRREWDGLKLVLHPYLHWISRDGRTIRGRQRVLAYLAATAVKRLPEAYELRDGQIYRWVESAGQV
ncbi:MAG TPA: hypothetical protein VM674_02705 [Candidatus Acidoferrum sp.]|nr:hypothetical protein [Candidatus Acidoferrum sp.]